MIHGTGVDIIEISRIKKSMDRYAGKFEEKIFTPQEIEYCRSQANPCKHFAGRFAAKEAVLKSLGTGMAQGIFLEGYGNFKPGNRSARIANHGWWKSSF